MIAADTSTWIAFLQGDRGEDAELLDQALQDKQVVMVPAVLTELLSDPKLEPDVGRTLAALPLLEVRDGFWIRAGGLRAAVWAQRRKARLGDALIAQFLPGPRSIVGHARPGFSCFRRCGEARPSGPIATSRSGRMM